MRWAIVNQNNFVDNVVIWSGGESLWPDMTPVQLDPDERCAPGWVYDPNGTSRFIEPPLEPES